MLGGAGFLPSTVGPKKWWLGNDSFLLGNMALIWPTFRALC